MLADRDAVATISGALWQRPKPRTRGPAPAYALDDVLDAAIGIADAEGLEAVSMQRVAEALGFTKMAIYRYVPGRAELVALMTDRALGQPPDLAGTTWRERMEAWAQAVFELFRAHPWEMEATTGPRVLGPNEVAWAEAGLAILAATGLDGAQQLDVLAVILGHVRGVAQQLPRGSAADAVETAIGELTRRALEAEPERFPLFLAATRDAAASGAQNQALAFGLACILDGVEQRLARAGQGGPIAATAAAAPRRRPSASARSPAAAAGASADRRGS